MRAVRTGFGHIVPQITVWGQCQFKLLHFGSMVRCSNDSELSGAPAFDFFGNLFVAEAPEYWVSKSWPSAGDEARTLFYRMAQPLKPFRTFEWTSYRGASWSPITPSSTETFQSMPLESITRKNARGSSATYT